MLRPSRTFTVVPSLPPRLSPLSELAFNLWWSWQADVVELFRRLDGDLWAATHQNPVLMLGRITQDRLDEVAEDDGFIAQMMRVYQNLNRYMRSGDTWYAKNFAAQTAGLRIAYFSMEFGITECMEMYSGGLGVLAGDHLKAASDLGLPLVAVGLLYQQGYFHQYLNADGWQQELYPTNDFHNLPIQLERDSSGAPITVQVDYPGRSVSAQIWRVQVGRVALYMLDANIEANRPEDRAITAQLYGGDLDMRIRQEILLGIGGMRALRALGIEPTICHMNDGHPAFLALERIRMAMQERGISFAEARTLTMGGNVFTTHTPVPAGIDLFPPHFMDGYFGAYYQQLGISRDEFLQLGRPPAYHPDENFSMAILALRLSGSANGVSKRHGEVAREMWRELWPGTPTDEVPIGAITNGVHPHTWISSDMAGLLLRYLGPRWAEQPEDQSVWDRIDRIPDEELWHTHERRRERLVAVARERLAGQLAHHGASASEVAEASEVLHPEVLTIGFARRFATYKRAMLLFSDPDRLARILNDPQRPVQIIFAGKAHPRDNPGKEFIRQIVHMARREDLKRRVIFLEDYDMALSRYMLQGVDVWLNTPQQGKEASGTSGMKAAMNGAINLSTLDGWWVEGYSPQTGWRVGSGEAYDDSQYGNEIEAEALYDLLEQDVTPLFYRHGSDGLPRQWIAKMKASMREIAPVFNTHRMVRQYAEESYFPSYQRFHRLQAEDARLAKELSAWMQRLYSHWGEVRIVSVESDAQDGTPVRSEIAVRARIELGSLSPEDVAVHVYHGTLTPETEMTDYGLSTLEATGVGEGGYLYGGSILVSSSGRYGLALRVTPHHAEIRGTQLPGLALWSS